MVFYNVPVQNQINKNKSFENKIMNVLVENLTEDKINFFGRSEYMTPVILNGSEENIGKVVPVKITGSNKNTLFGKIVNNSNQKVA